MNQLEPGLERVKLFVGMLPRVYTETQLVELFSAYVPVVDACVLRDHATRQGRGCGFVVVDSKDNAERVISALNDKPLFPEVPKPLQVRFADGELQRLQYRVFVGMIPSTVTLDEFTSIASAYGTILDINLLPRSGSDGKSYGFIKYSNRNEALSAIAALDGKCKLHGSPLPLMAKFADTERDKVKRTPAPSYSAPFHGKAPAHPTMYSGGGHQYPPQPMAPPMGNPHYNPYGMPPQNTPYMRHPTSGSNAVGPSGANLFVYHIPSEYSEDDLRILFAPYGPLVSTNIFMDRRTGTSKGFGFVSYDSPLSAAHAIQALDGFMIGNKKLKVQLKTDRRPY